MKRLAIASLLWVIAFSSAASTAQERRIASGTQVMQKEDQSMRDKESSGKAKPPISWDSPRMRWIEKEWTSLDIRDAHPTEEGPEARREAERIGEARESLLKKQLSSEDMRGLATSCGTLPISRMERGAFTNELLTRMVGVFLKSGDRDSLVTLLSTRFPKHAGFHMDTENALVVYGAKLKDPILLLGEAYAKCKVPEVRRDIAVAVRQGFTGLGVDGKDDDEFVKNAMDWFEQHKDRATVNRRYFLNCASAFGDYNTNPLFTLQTGEAERKGVKDPKGPIK